MAAQLSKAEMDQVATITNSRYRLQVARALLDGHKTPSGIVEFLDTDAEIAHISRAVQELRDDDITELLVPEERQKGRIYGLKDGVEPIATAALEM